KILYNKTKRLTKKCRIYAACEWVLLYLTVKLPSRNRGNTERNSGRDLQTIQGRCKAPGRKQHHPSEDRKKE
ncbi:MAG: hypothetical protein KHY46_16355, partial [Clostridiales bacterium]|nr:hypothetical protein [Clostridiales bacterium]